MSGFSLASLRLRLKYDREFHTHFANPLSELIYDHIHTPFRTIAKDLLFFTEEEWLWEFVPSEEGKTVIAESADLFEKKQPQGLFPVLLHTEFRQILERRRKRLHKLHEDKVSSQDTSQSQLQKTVTFLGKSLQNFTFTNMESPQPSSVYAQSFCDVYSSRNSAKQLEIELSHDFQIQKEHIPLRSIVQATVQHLILDFDSKTLQTGNKEGKKQALSGGSSTSQALDSVSSLGSDIESVVMEQLKKYKIAQLFDRTSVNSQRSHRTVRDKAEQFLKNIRRDCLD